MKTDQTILVAIHCLVYNQEPYLRQCLDGFVMQKTNFRYVAVVHDDASTDGSVAIIREYAEKYPEIIKPIYETENQWRKHEGLIDRIMFDAIKSVNSKYVAMCEGDDYWINPLKLQKQVDFMESHPDFSICFHRVKCLMSDTGELVDEYMVGDMPGESTVVDLSRGNYIHTPSVMFRWSNRFFEKKKSLGECLPGDYVIWMLNAENGKIWKMEEPMAVYRVGSGVWSNKDSIRHNIMALCTLNKLYAVIEDKQAKEGIQEQIEFFRDFIGEYVDESIRKMQKSWAYRIGKVIVKPLAAIRKMLHI